MKKMPLILVAALSLFLLAGCSSALLKAARSEDVGRVKALLAKGANANDGGSARGGVTALMEAAGKGNLEIVEILLDKGANINLPSPLWGLTALSFGVCSSNPKVVPFLIARGADIDTAITGLQNLSQDPYINPSLWGWPFSDPGRCIRALEKLGGRASRSNPPVARKPAPRTGLTGAASSGSSLGGLFGGMAAPKRSMPEAVPEDETPPEPEPQVRLNPPPAPPPPPPAVLSYHSDIDLPQYKSMENSNNFAVVVGVEKYLDLPEAQFAERDAEAVREHLIALGFPSRNISVLTGPKATKTGLVKNIETWLPNNVNEQSTVFFYYSGHGAPDASTAQAYLVPVDGDPQYLPDTGYPLKRLYEKLNGLKAKSIIVALDSCFSGAGGRSVLAKGTRPLVTQVDVGSAGTGRVIALTASDGNQISGTLEEQGHGLFTYYLLSGLNGAAKDERGNITVQSLYAYLVPKVQDAAKRGNRDQTPQLTPALRGEDAYVKLR